MATEKQITWAKDIKAEKLAEANKILSGAKTDQQRANATEAVSYLSRIHADKFAAWWIDHRNSPTANLMVEVYQQFHQSQ